MAKTIPQLTDATTVNAADELIIQQGGITKRATGAELAKGLNNINGTVSIKDFGAAIDGITNDTAAWNAAFAYAIANNAAIRMPAGTSIVDGLFFTNTNSKPLVLIGESRSSSIIKKGAGAANVPVLKINADGSGFNLPNCFIAGITFDGNSIANTPCGLELNDLSRCVINNVSCQRASTGLSVNSSYFVTVVDCLFENNSIGVACNKLANSSFPTNTNANAIYFDNCLIMFNSVCGALLDHCNHIQFHKCGIEINGTTIGTADQGGIFVGANAGSSYVGTTTPACLIQDCWFEQNVGIVSAAQFASGFNVAKNCFLWTNPTDATHDFNVTGGRYIIDSITIASTKTANINEGASVSSGNKISMVPTGNFNINRSKTCVEYGSAYTSNFINARGEGTGVPAFTLINSVSNWSWRLVGSGDSGIFQGSGQVYEINAQSLAPSVDNYNSLGTPSKKWSVVYSATGTINTSDARAKTDIEECALGLEFINSLNPVSYKWIVGGHEISEVDENGFPTQFAPVAGHRTHFGLVAQEVRSALPNGLDFAGWVLSDKDDDNSEQGLRYDQFIAPIIKSIQQLTHRVEQLELA